MKAHYDQAGFKAEKAIALWLVRQGYKVRTATWDEDVHWDIDFWVSGRQFTQETPVSVKSMATGIVYGTLGFELTTERGLLGAGWFETGRATQYLIIRDPQLIPRWRSELLGRIPMTYTPRFCWLPKQRVCYHIATKGWAYKRGLTPEVLERQGGKNTISGYLYCKDILKPSDIELLPTNWCAMVGIE